MAHIYGQFVIGPPGSGKTTYCKKMSKLLEKDFGRKVAIVNLGIYSLFISNPIWWTNKKIILLVVLEILFVQDGGLIPTLKIQCPEKLHTHFDWL